MKTRKVMKKILFCAAIALVSLQACDISDDDQKREVNNVSQQAKQALNTKYPDANKVEWHSKNNYVIAEFSNTSSSELSAWFDDNGVWYMTESDIRFDQLPQVVKTSFSAGQYASWRVDDVDKIERNATETVYVIEVENKQLEIDLYYSSNGVLVKETVDADRDYDYEDYIPAAQSSAIEAYLKTNYPNAKILEVDKEGTYTEVEILVGQVKRDLVFDNNYAWVYTKTEWRIADVPTAIIEVLRASEYVVYRIDDVDHYQTPASEYYRFDLESATGDVRVDITATGVLTVVDNTSDDLPSGGLNQSVNDFINQKYTGARIIETEYEKGYFEVDIYHENKEKTVRFNAANTWINTQWDIRLSELPQAVKAAIANTHTSYKIDDIEYFQTPNGEYFNVELEKGDSEVTLHIKADGTLI